MIRLSVNVNKVATLRNWGFAFGGDAGHLPANVLADVTVEQRYEIADILVDFIGIDQLLQAGGWARILPRTRRKPSAGPSRASATGEQQGQPSS